MNNENKQPIKQDAIIKNPALPAYPMYVPEEDIYHQAKEEMDIDPENITKDKEQDDENELDIPGSELDDDQEMIGSEDEENNYYSIGGDNHDNLEEDQA